MARRQSSRTAKPKLSKQPPAPDNAFVRAVGDALDWIDTPTILGERSPLAAPYFLGRWLDQRPDSASPDVRGRVLAQLLTDAVASLDDLQGRIVSLYYLDPAIRRNRNRGNAVATLVNYGRATVMRSRRDGVAAVARALADAVLPPLRSEWPGLRSVIGRAQIVNAILGALRDRETAVLTGPSGIGKTSVGYLVAKEWGRDHTLWFTLRPGLNDRLLSFVLTLGYFLRGIGAGSTWAQLVADSGRLTDDALISSLIRADLQALRLSQCIPLVCVDEMEVLRSELQEHSRLRLFIESLRDELPLLLIGQRSVVAPLEPRNVYELQGLKAQDYHNLLTREGLFYLPEADREQLLRATHGSPGLIRLFAMLHRDGETLASVFGRIGSASTTEAMLNRVWMKLGVDERRIMTALAVFNGYAPRDAWSQPEAQSAISTLIARGLIDDDGHGGVMVAAFVRDLVLRQSTADARRAAHEAAAQVYETRGEYSLALMHYLDAGLVEAGVRLWAQHRHAECARGFGPVVLAKMRDVPVSSIRDASVRAAFTVAMNALLYADGDSDTMLATLSQVDWREDDPLTPIAYALNGNAHLIDGNDDAAMASYQAAYDALELPAQAMRVNVLRQLGYVRLYTSRNLEAAERAAWQARFEAEILTGNVEEERGRYDRARAHYDVALAAAANIKDNARQLHDAHGDIGRLLMRCGDYAASLEALERALSIGKALNAEQLLVLDYINLSAVNIMLGRYDAAIDTANAGLRLCERLRLKSSYYSAGLMTNAGEAHVYLGRHEDALSLAQQAIDAEEPAYLSYAYAVYGMASRGLHLYDSAATAFERALQIAQQQFDRYAEASALREQGVLFRALDREPDAESALAASLAIFEELGNAAEAARVRRLMRESPNNT